MEHIGEKIIGGGINSETEVKYMVLQKQHKLDGFLTLFDATRLSNINRIGYYKWLQKNGPDPDTIQFEIEIRDEAHI